MEGVRNWLRGFGLEEYVPMFEEDGWDKLHVLFHINEEELENCIHKPGHRKRFHLALETTHTFDTKHQTEDVYPTQGHGIYPNIDEVNNWLKRFGLDQYISNFEDKGWDTLDVLSHMNGEDIKTCICKPGHRKKLQLAIAKPTHADPRPFFSKQEYSSNKCESSQDIEVCSRKQQTISCPKEAVDRWLINNDLAQYIEPFEKDGWDTLEVLFQIDEECLKHCISKPGHRTLFQLAIKEYESGESPLGSGSCKSVCIKADSSNDDERTYQTCMETTKTNSNTVEAIEIHLPTDSSEDRPMKQILQKQIVEPIQTNETGRVLSSRIEQTIEQPPAINDVIEEEQTEVRESLLSARTGGEESMYSKVSDNPKQRIGEVDEKARTRPRLQFMLSLDETGSRNEAEELYEYVSEDKKYPNDENLDDTIETISMDSNADEQIFEDNRDAQESKSHIKLRGQYEEGSLVRTRSMPPFIPSTIIINPKKVKIGDTFEKYTLHQTEKIRARGNFKKQMRTILNSSKEKDSLYVETRAFKELEHIVQANHWAVVIGVPGDGKTAMGAHLSLQYNKKGYEHLELHFARDWKDWVDGSNKGKKQFILIDDIFGRMSVDERKVSEWSSIIDLMQRVVKQRAGDLIVVCTSRKYVFMDVKAKLAHFNSFKDSSVVDLTQGQFALTRAEKLKMWEIYAEKYSVETEMPECIDNDSIKRPHGFPHCVEMFATNRFLQNEGISFFENPMECVCTEINNFKENDRIKYYVLLLVLFSNNILSESILEEITCNTKSVRRIIDAAGLPKHPTIVDLRKALCGLKNTYISEFDKAYSFSHDSIRENLAFLFIKDNPNLAIDDIDFNYLTDHTRCYGQIADDKNRICVLSQKCNILLVKRMIKEIKDGNVVAVCAHQAWNNASFITDFMDHVLHPKTNDELEAHLDRRQPADIFNTKDSQTSYIFDFSLFDALRFFGHRNAVSQLLEYKELEDLHGVIEFPTDLKRDRQLSLYLCRAMDIIGASHKLRQFQIHAAVAMEILDTLCTHIAGHHISCYIFGSHSEGTRIKTHITKLESYVNYVFCHQDSEVIQNISAVQTNKPTDYLYLLTVRDEITKPGYVKLQIVRNGIPQTNAELGDNLPENTRLDYKNRVVVYRRERRPDEIQVDEILGSKKTTDIVTGHPIEICYSYRCRAWPDIARKWLTRVRHHNWPSRYAVEQIKSLGYFLVPVGGRGSIEKHLEWKMSFLLQERMLMSSLNETQYKCYIILKMINNDVISHFVKEEALVSYHLKTCMFYVVENTPADIWQPDNILDCVQICLKCILRWIEDGICPNYFIPEENMFYRRIHGEVQSNLRYALTTLLSSDFKYFPYIQCGNLSTRLQEVMQGAPDSSPSELDLVPDKLTLYIKAARFITLVKSRIVSNISHANVETCVKSHFRAVQKLKSTNIITDHSKQETKFAIFIVLPYIELSLMANLVALEKRKSVGNKPLQDVLLSKQWNEIVNGVSDPFSAKLKQATFCYMLEQTYASLHIVESLDLLLNCSLKVSVCGCLYHQKIAVDYHTNELVQDMSEEEFRTQNCIPCILFLPTEREIIPKALRYEMQRPTGNGSSSNSETVPYQFWYNWAVVDGKILLYFLSYLIHSKTNMLKEAQDDIGKLNEVIEKDKSLGHKETGLNILGWIYAQEGQEEKAEEVLLESISVNKAYNAAYSHMENLKKRQHVGFALHDWI